MKYIVDIKGEIEGDYEIIGKYEERPQGECCGSCYLCDVGDCGADMKAELQSVIKSKPKNKWIYKKGNGYAKCPVCYHLTTCWSEEELKDYRYCYYCGTMLEKGGTE